MRWYEKRPYEDVSQSVDDPSEFIVASVPDAVRLPPELGGASVRVIGSLSRECPLCDDGAPIRHLACEGNYGVAECRRHGFVWYRVSGERPD